MCLTEKPVGIKTAGPQWPQSARLMKTLVLGSLAAALPHHHCIIHSYSQYASNQYTSTSRYINIFIYLLFHFACVYTHTLMLCIWAKTPFIFWTISLSQANELFGHFIYRIMCVRMMMTMMIAMALMQWLCEFYTLHYFSPLPCLSGYVQDLHCACCVLIARSPSFSRLICCP